MFLGLAYREGLDPEAKLLGYLSAGQTCSLHGIDTSGDVAGEAQTTPGRVFEGYNVVAWLAWHSPSTIFELFPGWEPV